MRGRLLRDSSQQGAETISGQLHICVQFGHTFNRLLSEKIFTIHHKLSGLLVPFPPDSCIHLQPYMGLQTGKVIFSFCIDPPVNKTHRIEYKMDMHIFCILMYRIYNLVAVSIIEGNPVGQPPCLGL